MRFTKGASTPFSREKETLGQIAFTWTRKLPMKRGNSPAIVLVATSHCFLGIWRETAVLCGLRVESNRNQRKTNHSLLAGSISRE